MLKDVKRGWRTTHPTARGNLDNTIQRALRLLRSHPKAAPFDEDSGYYRLFLGTIPYVFLYRVNDAERHVEVVAFWHTSRLPPTF